MSAHGKIGFGPRLVENPTGPLRSAILIKPSAAIELVRPIAGEPGAIYERAREQHDVLRSTLEYFGVETISYESHGRDAYEISAADAAVALRDGVVLMRPSAMSRRAEADRMQSEFACIDVPIAGHIQGPGLLDGSDVILAGETAFVGAGSRGNEIGREGFARLAAAHGYHVVEVKLAPGVQALRSVAAAIANDTIVIGGDSVDPAGFEGCKTIVLERGEENAAGVLCLDERHVLADIRYRTALAQMGRQGITVEAIDLYEFTKIGLTPAMLTLVLKRD
jgi:dimethylargininase